MGINVRRTWISVASVFLLAACGGTDLTVGLDQSSDQEQEVRGKAACNVAPSPALVGQDYVVTVSGMRRGENLTVHLTDASGRRDQAVTTDNYGQASFTTQSSAEGAGSITVDGTRRGSVTQLASCSFQVIVPPVCGDGVCGPTESCTSCAADCGACAPVCGDGVCASTESCSSCAADCGACAPVCGDGVCASTESCSSCAADCGACQTCEPAVSTSNSGRHNAGKDCLGCHAAGGSATPWTLAGTLYSDANGSSAVSGATIVVKDSAGKTFKLITALNGNFYTGDTTIQFPVQVVASKCPSEQPMQSSVSDGSCNGCHGSGFRVHLP